MSGISRGRVGIRDVARAAGVSVTTVSHALNDKGRVLPDTRARVLAEATRLGYSPNKRASGLRSGRSHTVSLVMPYAESARYRHLFALDFYQQLTASTVQSAFDQDQAVLLLPPIRRATELRSFDVDGGIIVDPTAHDRRVDMFAELGLPTVTVGQDIGRPHDVHWAAGDNRANVAAMLDHLTSCGAQRIALISVASDVAWFVDNENEYLRWMRERGLRPQTVLVRLDRSGGPARETVAELLRGNDRPDAIYAPPYWVGAAVVQAARDTGLRIPDDLLVALGVDSQRAQLDRPALTACDLRPDLIAAAAVDLLSARIQGSASGAGGPALIPGELRVRESTGGPLGER